MIYIILGVLYNKQPFSLEQIVDLLKHQTSLLVCYMVVSPVPWEITQPDKHNDNLIVTVIETLN